MSLPHTSEHVVAAGQSVARWPLHDTGHGASGPQCTMQLELPVHDAWQPPRGHSMSQVLFPPHDTTVPAPTATWQVLLPLHETAPLSPVVSVHVLDPSQLDVQFAPQIPVQTERPAQWLVHPTPQSSEQSFFDAHS